MPIRGETIGSAYVRILADGTGFAADTERQVREARPTFEKAGTLHAQAYQEGWDDGQIANPNHEFEQALSRGQGRYNRIGELLANGLGQGFEDEVNRLFPDIGDQIIQNLRNDLATGSIGEEELITRLHNLRAEAARAYQDIANRNTRVFNQMEESVKRYAEGLDNSGRSRRAFLRDIRHMVENLPDAVTRMDGFRASVTHMRREVSDAAPRLARFRADIDKVGDSVGRVFGKGSRNNFINFFGGFIGGVSRMTRSLTTFYKWPGLAAEQIGRFVAKIQSAIDEADNWRGALVNLASQGLPGLIAAVGAVVALMSTLAVSLGPAAAAVVGLTGAVLALAGSLGFALVGAASVAAGALFPLAVGIGVVALALGGLDKKNKDVKKNLKALKDEWKELQRHAAKGLFGKDGGGLLNLKAVIEAVEPIVKSVSKALGGLLDELGKTAKTKGFNKMMEDLGKILGPMVTTLGHIAGNIGLGLIRSFIILEPYITQFLGWMEDVSKAFADAGKSKGHKGGSPLADFFDKAIASAMRVWDLITSIGAVLGTLFGAGKSTGDNLITDLADQAKELNKWLTSPEGQKALKDMFAFAQDLAEALGRVVLATIRFVDALDTPTSRAILIFIIDSIGQIIGLLTTAAGYLDRWATALYGFGQNLGANVIPAVMEAVQGAIEGFGKIVDYIVNILVPDIQDAWGSMTLGDLTVRLLLLFEDLFEGIKQLYTGFFQWWADNVGKLPLPMQVAVNLLLGPWIWLYDALIGHSIIPDLINGIVDWFSRLPGMIFAVLGDLAGIFVTWVSGVPGAIAWVVGGIVGVFGGLAGKIIVAAGDVGKAFSGWFSPVAGIASRANTAIINAFSGLAGKIIKSAGSFSSALAGWLAPGPGQADKTSRSIASQFSGMASDSIKAAGSLASAMSSWGNAAVREAGQIANGIVSQFRGLHNDIEAAIGTVHIKVVVDMPSIPRPHVTAIVDMPKGLAVGAPAGPQAMATGAEATTAALNPAVSVDMGSAVRDLSSFVRQLQSGNRFDIKPEKEARARPTMNVAIVTPTEDPRAVASEVFNRLVAASYI